MTHDQFQQFVVDKLMNITQRLSVIEARSAMLGSMAGATAGLLVALFTKHFLKPF